ncbi:hypothetical protein Zmor_007071 [Zophobas morio]|uniref:Polyprotein n=2 Tax=Zophobas morio TaxID=2755281 RepID=A0AA38IUZ2_9CUCU|nr:hypothetical protein Zmor_007071 [Zophobas morio]
MDTGITFSDQRGSVNQLVAYSDADYASDEDRKSISGVVVILNGGPVSWMSRKQTIVADSTTYAEYVAAYMATKEIIWVRGLLADLGVMQRQPTIVHMDNAAAEHLVRNPVHHRRTKHIDVKFHYTRDAYQRGEIDINHVGTTEQLADMFTKPLSRDKFANNLKLLNLHSV